MLAHEVEEQFHRIGYCIVHPKPATQNDRKTTTDYDAKSATNYDRKTATRYDPNPPGGGFVISNQPQFR